MRPIDPNNDDPEYDGWDDRPLGGAKAVGWLANVTAGGLLALDPTGLTIIGANALEKLAATAYELDVKARVARMSKRVELVHLTADELGVEPEGLAEALLDSDLRAELFSRALNAAAETTTLQDKIKVLSAVVASGVRDDSKLDESFGLVEVLERFEVPHLRVLMALFGLYNERAPYLSSEPYIYRQPIRLVRIAATLGVKRYREEVLRLQKERTRFHAEARLNGAALLKEIEERAQMDIGETSILGDLVSKGLAEHEYTPPPEGYTTPGKPRWRVSPFGISVLALFRDEQALKWIAWDRARRDNGRKLRSGERIPRERYLRSILGPYH